MLTCLLLPAAANPLKTVDSLLASYQTASRDGKVPVARQLIKLCMADDVLIDIGHDITLQTPADSIDMYVWYATERFYYNNSYFKESLEYIAKTMPLAAGKHPDIYATLLCDRGYCLFKTGRNTEATEAEKEAEKYSKEHNLLMPLARAYNYLTIINVSLGYVDEAKHFILKAIETDRLTGSDQNTHNYYGIACEVYNVANEPDLAVEYGHKAVEAARKIGYADGVVNHLSQLSYAYNRKGDLPKALEMSKEAVATVEKMDVVDRNLLAISLEYMAFNLLDMKRNSEAVPVIRRAIALQEEVGNTRSVCYDHKSLAEALEPDNPRDAIKALRRYTVMMDSIHYAEMHEMLSKTNAELHNDELQGENIRSKHRLRMVLVTSAIILLLLLAVIAVLTYINRLRTRLQKATERQQALREEFYTNVTHEFRTPLTVIMGVARQLGDSMVQDAAGKDVQVRDGLSLIERNGQQLLTLVNQLLDMAKATTATVDVRWVHGNIVGYIGMVVEPFGHLGNIKGVDVSFGPESGDIETDFVPDYVQKIVSNLLSNALKFTPQGGKVSVTTGLDGNQLVVSVADTGQGILAEDLPHIFEPFFQGANNTFTGTGVGLALVKQLTEAVGGEVSATSTPGEGTTFTVHLPLLSGRATGDADDVATVVPARPLDLNVETTDTGQQPLQSSDTGRTRILVVEDNADVAYYIGNILGDRYDVAYASNGKQGMEQARQLTPDLIVTDIMMPDVDGLELCRLVRADVLTNHIPIVIITARATDNDRLEGIQAGADAYLYKPFRSDELLLRVEKLLEQRRMLQLKFSARMADARTVVTRPDAEVSVTAGDETAYERNVSQPNQDFLASLDDVVYKLMPECKTGIEQVAAELHMTRSQLARKLRAVIDMSPAAYILDIRLREAKRLLLVTPPLTLLEVALRCGFGDHAHLTHTFRNKFGITPTQYIKQAKPADD